MNVRCTLGCSDIQPLMEPCNYFPSSKNSVNLALYNLKNSTGGVRNREYSNENIVDEPPSTYLYGGSCANFKEKNFNFTIELEREFIIHSGSFSFTWVSLRKKHSYNVILETDVSSSLCSNFQHDGRKFRHDTLVPVICNKNISRLAKRIVVHNYYIKNIRVIICSFHVHTG